MATAIYAKAHRTKIAVLDDQARIRLTFIEEILGEDDKEVIVMFDFEEGRQLFDSILAETIPK